MYLYLGLECTDLHETHDNNEQELVMLFSPSRLEGKFHKFLLNKPTHLRIFPRLEFDHLYLLEI